MSKPFSFYEVYKNHRTLFLSVIMLPVVGMIISILIVLWKAPKNQLTVVAFTFFLMVQYIVTIIFLINRIKRLNIESSESKPEY